MTKLLCLRKCTSFLLNYLTYVYPGFVPLAVPWNWTWPCSTLLFREFWFLGLLTEQNLLASWEPHNCFLTRLCLQVVTSPLLLRYSLTWHPLLHSWGSSVLHCVCFGALPPHWTSESWSWPQYEKGLIFIVQGLLPLPAPEWWPCLVWRGKWSPCV